MSVKVIDKGWKKIVREMEVVNGSFVKVGILSDAGKHESDSGEAIDMAELATIHEFGEGNVPERPFMRQAFDTNRAAINSLIQKEQAQILEGRSTVRSALNSLGVFFTGKVGDIFTEGEFVPNAPSTIARKRGSTRPLIDTGRLRQSVSHEVHIG